MHIFQKRKELPPFRSRWARRREAKVEEEAKGEIEEGLLIDYRKTDKIQYMELLPIAYDRLMK